MRYPGKLSFLAARRGLVPRLAGTGYVLAAAMRAEGARGSASGGWARSRWACRRRLRGSSRALVAGDVGASIALASLAVSEPAAWMDALGIVGVLVASLAACAALARMSDQAQATPTLVPKRDRSASYAMGALSLAGGWSPSRRRWGRRSSRSRSSTG